MLVALSHSVLETFIRQHTTPVLLNQNLHFEASWRIQVSMGSMTQGVHIPFGFCLQPFSFAFLGGSQESLQGLEPTLKRQ